MPPLIRPIEESDLHELEFLAAQSGSGLTSLPADARLLHEKIERSHFAFTRDVLRPKGESYLFVLEHPQEKRIIGCAGLLSKTGGYEPVYAYRLRLLTESSSFLSIKQKVKTLQLEKIYNGPSEVCTLYLLPDYRKEGLGRFLSLARFLYLGVHPDRFEKMVSASMRGHLTEQGSSPFWEVVCNPFFQMSYGEANRLRYIDPRFIEELVPKHPLYIPLLPQVVQECVGKTHPNTLPALNILRREGFRHNSRIDIFDGGPFFSAELSSLRIVRSIRYSEVGKIHKHPLQECPLFLIGTRSIEMRIVAGHLRCNTEGVAEIDQGIAKELKLEKGQEIAYVEMESQEEPHHRR